MNKETILLTGAAGFIGAKTAELLCQQGYDVIGIDNLNDYYDVRIKQHRLNLLGDLQGFSFQPVDVEDKKAISKLFSRYKIDRVVNLAARAGVRYSMENPTVYLTTNALGTLHLLEAMREHNILKMVLASTSSLYAGQRMPFQESLAVNTPISPYAASKKAAEVMCYSYHHLYQMDISVVRYFTVYGPAGRPDMSIYRFIKWIDEGVPLEMFGDGSQSRDFTYVDDIAAGTVKAMQTEVGYEIINLGGGQNPISMNTVIAALESLLGKSAKIMKKPFHIADLKETWADISKADRLLDWNPRVSLEEGLKLTVDWYKANRDWLKDIPLP